MKTLKGYTDFLYEKRKTDLINIPAGYAVVINRDIDISKDVDFKKTAETWWGRNVANITNMQQKDSNRKLYKGDILWIQYDKNYVFTMNVESSSTLSHPNQLMPTLFKESEIFTEFRKEIITILNMSNDVTILKYEKIKSKFRDKFETDLKIEKIKNAIRKDLDVIYNDEIVTNIIKENNIISVSTVDNSNKVTPGYKIKYKNFSLLKFLVNDKLITGSPFDTDLVTIH